MANKKIVELDAASQVNSDAVFPLSQLVNSNQKTLKATVAQMQAAMLAPVSGLVTLGESSGSIASFSTDIADKLYSCYVNVTAVQSGSGTPAPDNVRAISGWSACNLSVNSVVTSIPFNTTVYGGVLDVLSGVLTVTYGAQNLGDLTWTYNSTAQQFRASLNQCKPPITGAYTTGLLCPIYKEVPHFDLANENYAISRFFASVDGINVKDSRYTDENDYKTAMNGIYLYYPLKTPTTIQLTPTEVKTILGQNNIFGDCGDIDLKYLETIGNRL